MGPQEPTRDLLRHPQIRVPSLTGTVPQPPTAVSSTPEGAGLKFTLRLCSPGGYRAGYQQLPNTRSSRERRGRAAPYVHGE